MACTYTFNGKTYTEQEFRDYIADNREQLISTYIGTNLNNSVPTEPDSIEQQYYSDPLISKIGTLDEYRIFMNTASDTSIEAFASIVDEPVLPSGETKYEYVQYIKKRAAEKDKVQREITPDEVEQLVEYDSVIIKSGVAELFESNPELANTVYEAAGFKQNNILDLIKKEPYEETNITLSAKDWSKIVYARHAKTHYADSPRVLEVEKEIRRKGYLTENVEKVWAKIDDSGNIVISDGNHRILALNNINPEQNITIPIRYIPGENEVHGGNIFKLFNNQITPQQKQQAQQLYSQYLDTIFPDSKVKDIVYHGSYNKNIDIFNVGEDSKEVINKLKGIYFSSSKSNVLRFASIQETVYNDETGEVWVEDKLVGKVYPVVINIINPLVTDKRSNVNESIVNKDVYDSVIIEGNNKNSTFTDFIYSGFIIDEFIIFEPKQAHILGSKQDIELFSKYINNIDNEDVNSDTDTSSFPNRGSQLSQKDLLRGIVNNIDPDFDVQEVVYDSTILNSVEKDIIASAVTYVRESYAAYANRIRREPLNLQFKELIDKYEELDAAEIPDTLLNIQEIAQLIEILATDYAINKEALIGINGRNGILPRLNAFNLFDMQEIVETEQSRQNFADFMKKVSIVLKGFDRIETFLTSVAETKIDELKELNKVIKLHQSLMADVINAKAIYKRLLDSYFETRSNAVTTNPNVVQGMMNIFSAQDDETLTQLMVDSIADTHNVFVATTIKNYIRHMGNAQEEINNELIEFRDVLMKHFNLTDPKDLDKIAPEEFDKYLERDADGDYTGRLIQKYDWDKFKQARSEMYAQAAQYPKESPAYKAILQKWHEEHEVNIGLTSDQINEVIAERKRTLTDKAFKEWEAKNFSFKIVNNVTKRYLKVGGEFVVPSDLYLRDDYNTVKDDAIYKYLVKTLKKYASYDRVSNIINEGYLPVLHKDHGKSQMIKNIDDLSDWFNSHRAKRIDEFTGENNEVIRLLPFPMKQRLSTVDTIELPSKFKDEASIDYEIRALREIKEKGLGEFASLDEVKDHNDEIRKQNRKRHGAKFNRDVKGVVERFIKEATTYKYKKAIESELLLALEQIRNTKMAVRNDKGFQSINAAASKALKEKIYDTKTPGESNLAKHFDQWLEAIFYEGFDVDEGAWTAIGKIFLKYVSAKNMWLNLTSGVNNVIFGNLQVEIERAAKYFVTSADLNSADKLYWNNIVQMFADIGSDTASTYVSGFIKFMDIVESQTEKEVGAKILYKKLISTDTMYAMQEAGEHQMQNRMLLAMAHSHRVINGKIYSFHDYVGDNRAEILKSILNEAEWKTFNQYVQERLSKEKYIESKKNYVEDFLTKVLTKDHMAKYAAAKKKTEKELRDEFEAESNIKVIDAFELNNGLIGIKKTSEGQPIIDGREVAEFRNKVVHVNHKLHGIYNKFDAGTMQRYTLGKMAIQFRKWMRSGWTKRFGSRFGRSFWNESRKEWDDGAWITTLKLMFKPFSENSIYEKGEGIVIGKFMNNLLTDYHNYITNAKLYWSILSDHDKAQVRRTGMDMLYIALVVIIAKMLSKLGDDDDEKEKGFGSTHLYDFLMYQVDRMFSELIFYTPYGVINEGQKIVRSPTASYSTAIDIGKFVGELGKYAFGDEEKRYFEGGAYNDELKLKVRFNKLVPIVNQYQRLERLKKNNTYYNLFVHAR